MIDISDIHFHDSTIRKIIEIPETDTLIFEVDYPIDWENNTFEIRYIVFQDILEYKIEEGGFVGSPTFLDVYENGKTGERFNITLQTNAGTRSLSYTNVELLENPGWDRQTSFAHHRNSIRVVSV